MIKLHLLLAEKKIMYTEHNLNESLQIQRKKNTRYLHEYALREEFPNNTDYPKKRLPHIRDRQGVLCAVAHLIAKSGNIKLVNDLALQNNLVYIGDVKSGPLINWIADSGLTQKEAAHIQPSYCVYSADYCQFLQDFMRIAHPIIWTAAFVGLSFLAHKIVRSFDFSPKKKLACLLLSCAGAALAGLVLADVTNLILWKTSRHTV